MIAACNDGHGGESLYENLKNPKTPRELLDLIAKVSRNESIKMQALQLFLMAYLLW